MNKVEANKIANEFQEKLFQNVLKQIEEQAKVGAYETMLFYPLNFDNTKRLLELGFGVKEQNHPFEQRKVQLVSW